MIYLNNAATTWPKPEVVYREADRCLRSLGSPLRSSAGMDDDPAGDERSPEGHGPSTRCGGGSADLLARARADVAAFFGIDAPDRLVFTPGCTWSLNLAILGLPWEPGDAILMSGLEHHAVSRPVRKVARERGVSFRVAPYRPDEPIDLNFVEDALRRGGVKLLACTMASNVTGHVLPAAEITRLARQHGALSLIDAAQAAGVWPVKVRDLQPDLLTFAGHKGLFGPPGVGGLYVGPDVRLATLAEGGTGHDSGRHEVNAERPGTHEIGTHNLPAIAGLAAGVRWIGETGMDEVRAREHALVERLVAGLRRIDGVEVHGPGDGAPRTAAVSITLERATPRDAAAKLAREGVVTRCGYHCAPLAHESIGTLPGPGTLRLSPGFFNEEREIDAALSVLASLR